MAPIIKVNKKTLEALTNLNVEYELINDKQIQTTNHKYFEEGNFYKNLKEIKNQNYKLTTLEQFAYLRNQADFKDEIWERGSYTSAGVIYSPNQGENPIMVKESPLLDLNRAKKAVESHRNAKHIHTTKQEYEHYKQIAKQEESKLLEERTALILPFDENTEISTDSNVFKFAFGKEAKQYANKLKQKNTSQITVYLQSKKNTPDEYSINQFWLSSFVVDFNLDGTYSYLNDDLSTLGVF